MVDPNKNYDNITNYFTNYDVLTGTLIALNLDSRIPGKRYDISTGIPETGEGFNILKTTIPVISRVESMKLVSLIPQVMATSMTKPMPTS